MADDLVEHGYADGTYWNRCNRCEGTFMGAKSAPLCKGCAMANEEASRLRADLAAAEKVIVGMRDALELVDREWDGEVTDRIDFAKALALTPESLSGMRLVPVDPTEAMIEAGVIDEIAAERQRQITEEGWTPEHDDAHAGGKLAFAGASYAIQASVGLEVPGIAMSVYRNIESPEDWPLDSRAWKPKNPRRDLIRAAALIVAEIERLDRALIGASE